MSKGKYTVGYALALLSSALWGLTYVLDERVLEDFSSVKLYFLHCLFGLLISSIVWLITGGSFPQLLALPVQQSSGRVLLVTLIVGTLAGMAILYSIGALGASRASILEISYPFFVAIFSYILFSRGISLPVMCGAVLIFAGASIIVLSDS